jgi:hypothetical protein
VVSIARRRVVVGGQLADGSERWTNTFHFAPGTSMSAAQRQTWIDAFAALYESYLWSGSFLPTWADTATFDTCTMYTYEGTPATLASVTPAAGTTWQATGTGETTLPHEVAVVVGLRTAVGGRSGRGRVYLGGLSLACLDADGRVDAVDCQAFATRHAGLLSDANDLNTGTVASVFSPTDGELYQITSTDCGNVFDAQRRRRASLVETRFTAALT